MSNDHANHVTLNSLLRIQAENWMSEKSNKQISKCSIQKIYVTEDTRNHTETERQGSVL